MQATGSTPTTTLLLRLAIAALERHDTESARDLLGAALSIGGFEGLSTEPPARSEAPEFATVKTFARLCDATPRTLRRWLGAGRIPSACVVGSGRGLRIDVQRALAALRALSERSDAAAAGAEHARARARLHVLKGHRDG